MSDDIAFLRHTVTIVFTSCLRSSWKKHIKSIKLVSCISLNFTLILSSFHVMKKIIWVYKKMSFTSLLIDILTDLPYFYWDIVLCCIRFGKVEEMEKLITSLEKFDETIVRNYSALQELAQYILLGILMFFTAVYKVWTENMNGEISKILTSMIQFESAIASYFIIFLSLQLLHCLGNRLSSLAQFVKMKRSESVASNVLLNMVIDHSKILYESTIFFNSIFKLSLFFMVFTIIIYMLRVLNELILEGDSLLNALISVAINFFLFLVSTDR